MAASKERNKNEFLETVENLMTYVLLAFGAVVKAVQFLTQPPGSAIPYGLMALYFLGLNVEGYWQAINGNNVGSFIYKPFISDNPSFINLWGALGDASFWVAFLVSMSIQAVQAKVIRDVGVEIAKAQHEEVANYQVPDENPKGLKLAEHRRKNFIESIEFKSNIS